jgi:hypothetical protein
MFSTRINSLSFHRFIWSSVLFWHSNDDFICIHRSYILVVSSKNRSNISHLLYHVIIKKRSSSDELFTDTYARIVNLCTGLLLISIAWIKIPMQDFHCALDLRVFVFHWACSFCPLIYQHSTIVYVYQIGVSINWLLLLFVWWIFRHSILITQQVIGRFSLLFGQLLDDNIFFYNKFYLTWHRSR